MNKMSFFRSRRFGILCVAAMLTLCASVRAQDHSSGDLSIAKIIVKPLGAATVFKHNFLQAPSTPPIDLPPIFDHIINIGLKIWQIIKENAPVIDVNKQYATAVPEGITHWTQLSRWSPPTGQVYQLQAINRMGGELAKIKYQVIYSYGGRYIDKTGKETGRYLAGVTVEPLDVKASWGVKVDVSATIPSIINVGTSQDPVAGMSVNLNWTVATPFQKETVANIYFVDGNGKLVQVGGALDKSFAAIDRSLERWRGINASGWQQMLR